MVLGPESLIVELSNLLPTTSNQGFSILIRMINQRACS